VRPLLPAVPTPALLRAALDGTGPALLTDPSPRVVDALRPQDGVDDDVAVVVPTSGSTGAPKGVLLTADALLASARATAERLGDVGRWLLAIPPTHVGGLQVLVRAALAGREPAVLPDGPFTPGAFAAVTDCRATSLVPTQLRRLVADPAGLAALRRYDVVLLGGAAAPPALLAEARAAGARVVTTYGMSETSGGCVYDGVPLPGVRVQAGERVRLSGPTLAKGYRDGAPLVDPDGWFTTGDVGTWDGEVLVVHGRADDVVVTGGEKVAPAAVEAALAEHPAVVDAAVVGVPDAEWGARVVAVVVLRAPLTLAQARAHVAARLPRAAAPRALVMTGALPLLPSGKVDRGAVRRLAEDGEGTA
jgi:O-succinylbenzoic acid--CoA ligase